jgi:hypothetical protein
MRPGNKATWALVGRTLSICATTLVKVGVSAIGIITHYVLSIIPELIF